MFPPNDHILKVSGQYLNFQLSYSGLLIKLLTCGKIREDQVILVVALPNATVGQKATVGQGLPNLFDKIKETYRNIENWAALAQP